MGTGYVLTGRRASGVRKARKSYVRRAETEADYLERLRLLNPPPASPGFGGGMF
jgi:hypothetical protein